MKILIFDPEVSGHHLEYMHHLYVRATKSTDEFIFLTNAKFEEVKEKFHWEPCKNVKFEFLSQKEQTACDNPKLLKSAWDKSLILRKYAKLWNIDHIWLIMLIKLMPFLPFVLPKKILVSGIIYRIYLYDKEKFKGIRLLLERIRYWIMSKHRNIHKIFILNDVESTNQLNCIYKTNNFRYLPDPVPQIDRSLLKNIRQNYVDHLDAKIFLHFGALDHRKGTIEILQAINLLSEDAIKDKFFIFAGKINAEMKEEFYSLLGSNKNKKKIKVYDEFCSYDFLNNLCYSCDAILIPYKNAIHSSGVIGYASFFEKPVIGPSSGMLGKLIKEYSIGSIIDEITPESIKESLECPLPSGNTLYASTHKVDDFCDVFFKEEV